jgi:hypothetical protein
MINKLESMRKEVGDKTAIGEACIVAIKKLDEYYTLATNQRASHSVVATICDLRLNFNVFDILWNKSGDSVRKSRAKAQFQECFYKYNEREQKLVTEKVQASIEAEVEGEEVVERDIDSEDDLYIAKGIIGLESEWKRWIKEALAP